MDQSQAESLVDEKSPTPPDECTDPRRNSLPEEAVMSTQQPATPPATSEVEVTPSPQRKRRRIPRRSKSWDHDTMPPAILETRCHDYELGKTGRLDPTNRPRNCRFNSTGNRYQIANAPFVLPTDQNASDSDHILPLPSFARAQSDSASWNDEHHKLPFDGRRQGREDLLLKKRPNFRRVHSMSNRHLRSAVSSANHFARSEQTSSGETDFMYPPSFAKAQSENICWNVEHHRVPFDNDVCFEKASSRSRNDLLNDDTHDPLYQRVQSTSDRYHGLERSGVPATHQNILEHMDDLLSPPALFVRTKSDSIRWNNEHRKFPFDVTISPQRGELPSATARPKIQRVKSMMNQHLKSSVCGFEQAEAYSQDFDFLPPPTFARARSDNVYWKSDPMELADNTCRRQGDLVATYATRPQLQRIHSTGNRHLRSATQKTRLPENRFANDFARDLEDIERTLRQMEREARAGWVRLPQRRSSDFEGVLEASRPLRNPSQPINPVVRLDPVEQSLQELEEAAFRVGSVSMAGVLGHSSLSVKRTLQDLEASIIANNVSDSAAMKKLSSEWRHSPDEGGLSGPSTVVRRVEHRHPSMTVSDHSNSKPSPSPRRPEEAPGAFYVDRVVASEERGHTTGEEENEAPPRTSSSMLQTLSPWRQREAPQDNHHALEENDEEWLVNLQESPLHNFFATGHGLIEAQPVKEEETPCLVEAHPVHNEDQQHDMETPPDRSLQPLDIGKNKQRRNVLKAPATLCCIAILVIVAALVGAFVGSQSAKGENIVYIHSSPNNTSTKSPTTPTQFP